MRTIKLTKIMENDSLANTNRNEIYYTITPKGIASLAFDHALSNEQLTSLDVCFERFWEEFEEKMKTCRYVVYKEHY